MTADLENALAGVRQVASELRSEVDRARRTTALEADGVVERLAGDLGPRLDAIAKQVDQLAVEPVAAPNPV